jgi:hypothetical protein
MGLTERDVLRVASVREISRLCDCTWLPVFEQRRVTGWLLTFAARSCRFHGTALETAKRARPAVRRGARWGTQERRAA